MSVIIPFSGGVSEIPEGFVLCDGNNGSPDLTDKFVKCVPSDTTSPGSSVGQSDKQITESEMESHDHGTPTGPGGSHSHSSLSHSSGPASSDGAGATRGWMEDSSSDDSSPSMSALDTSSHEHGGSTGISSAGGSWSITVTNIPQSKKLLHIMEVEE